MKVFFVILAFIKAKGMPFFFALKIKFGQISESTKKIASGFHNEINFFMMKFTSIGKNLCFAFLIYFNSSFAIMLELKVTVVIKNSKFSFFLFNSSNTGIMLFSSPILAA